MVDGADDVVPCERPAAVAEREFRKGKPKKYSRRLVSG